MRTRSVSALDPSDARPFDARPFDARSSDARSPPDARSSDARPSPSSEPAASDDRAHSEGEDRGTLVETLSQAPPTHPPLL